MRRYDGRRLLSISDSFVQAPGGVLRQTIGGFADFTSIAQAILTDPV